MVELSRVAEACLTRLTDHYEAKDRLEAAINLFHAVEEGRSMIGADPTQGMPFPSPYRELEGVGFKWIRVRHYWISYLHSTAHYHVDLSRNGEYSRLVLGFIALHA